MDLTLDLEKIRKGKIENLRFADLSFADLRSADLSSADLSSAYLSSAYLRSANLSSAKYGNFIIKNLPTQILLKYPLLIFREEGYIQAGCYLKTIKEWEKTTVIEDQEFLDEWKDKILAFAK